MRPPNSTVISPTALIADGKAHVRRLCSGILEREGYAVFEASNATELMSLAARHRPGIIVADACLPDVDALIMAGSLRSDSGQDYTAIIVLTELDDAAQLMARLAGDVDDYLTKPIRPKELAARVRALPGRIGGQGELDRCHSLLGEHARVLDLLLDFSAVLAETEQLDRLVKETVAVTASLSSCRRVALMLPNSDSTSLEIATAIGLDSQALADLTVPVGEGVSGRVFQSGSRIVVDSVSQGGPHYDVYDSWLYNKPPALALAMRGAERTVGVLHLSDRVGRIPFTEWELDYLSLLSNCAAAAIDGVLTRQAREQAREAITVALASLAEHRDDDTGRHLERMTGYCLVLADRLRAHPNFAAVIDDKFIDNLRRAAPLHDIGKVAIPDHILLKPGKLTSDETEIRRQHAAIGAETIRSARSRSPDSGFLAMAEDIALGHHEWVDGSGYPRRVRGTRIPLSARIAAMADVYDALTSWRIDKDPMSHAQARAIIVDLSNRQFDPLIVEAFLATQDAFQRLAIELRDQAGGEGNQATPANRPDPSQSPPTDADPTTPVPRDRPVIPRSPASTSSS